MSNREMVKAYVADRLKRWENAGNEHSVRADLANLRRGTNKRPGELPELWGLLFRDLPEELMSKTGEPTWAEWAIGGALTLYALHRQGAASSAHKKGQQLGTAIGQLATSGEGRFDAVQRRFITFATARTMPERMHHLRGLICQLRSEDIPLDYVALAGDLYDCQTPDGAAKARLRWGQDLYRTALPPKPNKEREDNDHE